MYTNNSIDSNYPNVDEKVIVNIMDIGIGIDEKIFSMIFNKFVSRSFQGMGLGLYLSKCIIDLLGGKIWGKNNNDGPGATFSFSLPV